MDKHHPGGEVSTRRATVCDLKQPALAARRVEGRTGTYRKVRTILNEPRSWRRTERREWGCQGHLTRWGLNELLSVQEDIQPIHPKQGLVFRESPGGHR